MQVKMAEAGILIDNKINGNRQSTSSFSQDGCPQDG